MSQEEQWEAWKSQPPEAQVALDAALEKLAKDPDYIGCRWARPATGDNPMPPFMGWPGQAEPGVSWADLAQAQGDTLKTPNRWLVPALGMVLVRVKGGAFAVGEQTDTYLYRRHHDVVLTRDFWIGQFPVTNQQYARFTESGAHPARSLQNMAFAFFSQPASGISFVESQQYCKWASEKLGNTVRLPTELEWMRAARTNRSRFPWGDAAPTHAYLRPTGPTSSVLLRPQSASPWGCEDLIGNVWEWCLDYYGDWPPQVLKDWHRDKPVRNTPTWRVLKGGAYLTQHTNLHIDFTGRRDETTQDLSIGFRVITHAQKPGV